MTNIYYGPRHNHDLKMFWEKLVPLSKSVISLHDSIGDYTTRKCPAFMASMRNMYALPSPVDFVVMRREGDAPLVIAGRQVWSQPTLNNDVPYDHIAQALVDGYFYLFSDKPVDVEQLPPYLHSSNIYGISGRFDISTWFRSINFSSIVGENFFVKRGDPLMYLKFHTTNKIKLHTVQWPDEADRVCKRSTAIKEFIPNRPLSFSYSLFKRAKESDNLLRLARNNKWKI